MACREANVQFDDGTVSVGLRYPTYNSRLSDENLLIAVSCREPDWQLSFVEQICSSLHPLSTAEVLYVDHRYFELVWKDDAIENTLWVQLLLPFTAVINLYLSKEFAPSIVASLQELRMTEVLPSLQNIFVEALETPGSFQETIAQFVAARKLSDHPISISDWHWHQRSDMESM